MWISLNILADATDTGEKAFEEASDFMQIRDDIDQAWYEETSFSANLIASKFGEIVGVETSQSSTKFL